MATKKQPIVICCDACVLIDIITGAENDTERAEALRDLINSEENGECKLIFSVLIYPEILHTSGKMPNDCEKILAKFLTSGENKLMIATDLIIAKKAQAIRNKTNLNTPDAIHVATAIIAGANYLNTFDDGIIKWNGKPEVDGLAITKNPITLHQRSLI